MVVYDENRLFNFFNFWIVVMKKIIVLIIFAVSVFPQDAGKTGFAFLKNGFGARNIALGDFGIAGNSDVTALNYNPANIALNPGYRIFVSHNEWIQDIRSEMVGASFKFLGIPMAAGVNTTSISGIEVRHNPGDAEASFDAQYFFGSLSAGYAVTDNLFAGATIKYLYEGIYSDDDSGLAYDFGVTYMNLIDNLELAASVRNLGSVNKLRNESTKLPSDFRLGAAYDFDIQSVASTLKILGGIQKYTEQEDIHFHGGAEVTYSEILSVRLGYITGWESKSISFGMGVFWNSINFDYAYTPFDYGLGSGHTISLMYSF